MTTTTALHTILADLGVRIATHGLDAAGPAVDRLAQAARPFAPGAVDALIDPAGPEVARHRAFAVVSSHLLVRLPPDAAEHLARTLAEPSPVARRRRLVAA